MGGGGELRYKVWARWQHTYNVQSFFSEMSLMSASPMKMKLKAIQEVRHESVRATKTNACGTQ